MDGLANYMIKTRRYHVFSEDGMKETAYHVIDFAGFYPVWPIVEFSMAPTGSTKDK